MGRATILESLGEGLYRIAVDYGKARVETRIDQINGEIARLDEELDELEEELPPAQERVDDAADAVNEAIAAYRASIVPGEPLDTSGIQAAAEELIEATGERDKIQARIELIKTQRQAVKQDLRELESVKTEEQLEAWCADHTADASGEVATVEVPGEPQHILVAPSAPTPTTADGRLLARGAMSPEQAYLNAAILPGWQKWMPAFRSGVITHLSGDRCNVTLDPAESSAQGLNVNRVDELIDISIEYMECGGGAFAVDDHVVVNMTGEPNVVGFMKEPRACCFWPPHAEIPDRGAELVIASSEPGDLIQHKGAAIYRRRWSDSMSIPDLWSYQADESAFFATCSSNDMFGHVQATQMRTETVPDVNRSVVGIRVKCKTEVEQTGGFSSPSALQVNIGLRERGGAGMADAPIIIDGDTGGWVEAEGVLRILTSPTTADPFWYPFQFIYSQTATANFIGTVRAWASCISLIFIEE